MSLATAAANDAGAVGQKTAGMMLGCMCGDVLGASVENLPPFVIASRFPNGITDFRSTGRGFGCYTDDSQMAIALTRSLVQCGRCEPGHASSCYAKEFQGFRGYGASAVKILRDLQQEPESWKDVATKYIPEGSYANGGAMRIAPLGFAYRNAPDAVMLQAVKDALICTHVHPLGIDGAYVMACAVAKLCREPLGWWADGDAPLQLVRHLREKAMSEEMKGKMLLLEEALGKLAALDTEYTASKAGWAALFETPAWELEALTASLLSNDEFQIKATDAVACALLALTFHWQHPEEALTAAVHYGWDTDTIACMAGAMAGALHGRSWLPSRWVDNLENGAAGRDEVLGLVQQLALLDVRD